MTRDEINAVRIVIDAAEPMRLREEADCRLGIKHRNPVAKAIRTLNAAFGRNPNEIGDGCE